MVLCSLAKKFSFVSSANMLSFSWIAVWREMKGGEEEEGIRRACNILNMSLQTASMCAKTPSFLLLLVNEHGAAEEPWAMSIHFISGIFFQVCHAAKSKGCFSEPFYKILQVKLQRSRNECSSGRDLWRWQWRCCSRSSEAQKCGALCALFSKHEFTEVKQSQLKGVPKMFWIVQCFRLWVSCLFALSFFASALLHSSVLVLVVWIETCHSLSTFST